LSVYAFYTRKQEAFIFRDLFDSYAGVVICFYATVRVPVIINIHGFWRSLAIFALLGVKVSLTNNNQIGQKLFK
jgi:hypothetical protein